MENSRNSYYSLIDQEKQKAQMYIDVAEVIILVLNRDAIATLINKKGCEVTGYSKEEIIGRNWIDLVVPKSIQKDVKAAFDELLTGNVEAIEGYENPIVNKKGEERIISWHNVLIRDESGKVINVLSSGEDVTERKKAEGELEVKRDELKNQNKITSNFLSILEVTASSLNFNESLNRLLPHAVNLFDSTACLTLFINREEEDIQPGPQWGLSQELIPFYLSSTPIFRDTIVQPVISKQENQVVADIEKKLPECLFYLKELFRRLKTGSLLMMPISFENNAVAILMFAKTSDFSRGDKELAGKLRKHIESSFTAGKYAEDLLQKTLNLTQQLELVGAMSGIDRAILTSSSKKEITYSALRLLKKVISNNVIEVLDYDTNSDRFRLVAVQEDGRMYHSLEEIFDKNNMTSWSNISLGIPAFYTNLRQESALKEYENRFFSKSIKSLLIVPLISKNETLGLIAVGHKLPAAFSAQQLEAVKQLGNQIAVALSNMGLIDQLRDMMIGTINSLVTALDAKSTWTQGHSARVSDWAIKIGEALGVSDKDLYDLRLAALFHDIGKIGTYDVILDKVAKLNKEEYELIRKHPKKTSEILSPIPKLKKVAWIALHHHEKWNGGGYPDGLKGDSIPRLSRIIACADTFDAMVSDRPYREALSYEEAIGELSKLSGEQFDPEITAAFIKIIQDEITRKSGMKAA